MIIAILITYFSVLLSIAYWTGRNSQNEDFFVAGRNAAWWVVAFGMIGGSLSGATFLSVPGKVGIAQFAYFQLVLGNLLAYITIAFVLMPVYYRLELKSIYGYLGHRLGLTAYRTGSAFFLVSRTIGASARLYLADAVLHQFVFAPLGFPFFMTVLVSILLIWLYTFQGGIKTILWTDTFQTTCILVAMFSTLYLVGNALNLGVSDYWASLKEGHLQQIFFTDDPLTDKKYFLKQIFGGWLIGIAMTGLDQDLMQKNLTCGNLKDAQKNILSYSVILVLVNFSVLLLGGLLWLYARKNGIEVAPDKTDFLFPDIAINHLSGALGGIFALGLIASAYSGSDSALTALTTSFCIDFLNMNHQNSAKAQKLRKIVHISFSALFFIIILVFWWANNQALIDTIFKIASYTYGPLLGLFSFGLLTKRIIKYDYLIIVICLASPVFTYFLDTYSKTILGGYVFGFELMLPNALFTFGGLWLNSQAPKASTQIILDH